MRLDVPLIASPYPPLVIARRFWLVIGDRDRVFRTRDAMLGSFPHSQCVQGALLTGFVRIPEMQYPIPCESPLTVL